MFIVANESISIYCFSSTDWNVVNCFTLVTDFTAQNYRMLSQCFWFLVLFKSKITLCCLIINCCYQSPVWISNYNISNQYNEKNKATSMDSLSFHWMTKICSITIVHVSSCLAGWNGFNRILPSLGLEQQVNKLSGNRIEGFWLNKNKTWAFQIIYFANYCNFRAWSCYTEQSPSVLWLRWKTILWNKGEYQSEFAECFAFVRPKVHKGLFP